jgi:RND family efflux transporter MFP subunit
MVPRIPAILAVIVVLFSGCGRKQEKRLPPPPIKVGVATVDKGDLEHTLDVSGNLQFMANTAVSSEVAARIKSLEVRDGQRVQQGQDLLIFDDSIIRALVDQARGNLQKDEATLAFTTTEWEKNSPLLQSGAISQSTYDQKFSAYQNAVGQVVAGKGVLAKATEDLKNTVVKAPITGLLSCRYVEVGDWVGVGGKLFQLSDYTTVYLQGFMTDKDVGKLNVDQVVRQGNGIEARITADPFPDRVFVGKLRHIQPVMDQNRLFEDRIYIDNYDLKLLQGMFARGRIVSKRTPDVVRIPISALLERVRSDQSNAVVLVGKEDKAELMQIRVGAIDALHAEVVDGLKPGDRVVVSGKEVVNSGRPLKPMEVPRLSSGGTAGSDTTVR